MTDTCKNCTGCGKDFRIGINIAYKIKIKIRVRAFRKFFFCSYGNMAASDKGISLKKKFMKSEKVLTKLIQNDPGTILTG